MELKYHHIGIPTQERRDDEQYLPEFKVYVTSFDRSPFGVEWLRLRSLEYGYRKPATGQQASRGRPDHTGACDQHIVNSLTHSGSPSAIRGILPR